MASNLIRRLQQGLLASEDFAEVAKSKASLKVRIHNLRAQGFTIKSITADDFHTGRGRPSVAYLMVGMPADCCPHCGGRA